MEASVLVEPVTKQRILNAQFTKPYRILSTH